METCLSLIITEASHWYASPEWWLVAAFLTLGVVVAQTIATAKAAKAASDAASAAKLGVEAANQQALIMDSQTRTLIASERAWVMLTLQRVLTGVSKESGRDLVTLTVESTIRNLGKTPGRLTGIEAGLVMLDSGTSLDSLPKLPDFTKGHRVGPTPAFVPGLATEQLNLVLKCEGIRLGEILVVYGVVRYKHILSDEEVQTTFGYSINYNDRFEVLPPQYPEYNKSI